MALPLFHHRLTSPLGPMDVLVSEVGVRGLWFEDQSHRPKDSVWSNATAAPHHPLVMATQRALEAYWSGTSHVAWPRDEAQGTAFQRSVWQALTEVPVGQTVTYGELAQRVGKPSAVRALGAAVGRNPWSVLVPCHRVLGAKGALTGYAGGLPRKVALLNWEQKR